MEVPISVTPEDLVALDKAIVLGIRRVEYHDKIVEYQSRADMMKTRAFIVSLLYPSARRSRIYASVSKGTR